MEIRDSILDLIGNTPLVRLKKLTRDLPVDLVAKLEFLNPGGSVKDRIGVQMIEDAEKAGLLKPGGTIIEATSGNTGVGLAFAAAIKGYSCIFVMPDKMSQEKINALKAYGAEVLITPTGVAPNDPRSNYCVAKRLSEEIPNSYYPNQYENPSNPKAHELTTGPELWRQTDGKIAAFVAGAGTGGTLTGVARYLKSKNPKVKIVAVDPIGSLYHDKFHKGIVGKAQTYKIEGIGEDFFPSTMDLSIMDDVVQVTDRDAFLVTRALCRKEGIFVGGSAGAAVHGAIEWSKRAGLPKGAIVVVLLPDTGLRYLSKVHSDAWMQENRYLDARIDLNALQILERKVRGRTAHEIRGLIAIHPAAFVFEAVTLMREYEISQMPVIDSEGKVVGSIREDHVLDLIMSENGMKNRSVRDVMGPPFPIVDAGASIDEITKHFSKENPAVLIRRAGPEGGFDIVTKADLISSIATTK